MFTRSIYFRSLLMRITFTSVKVVGFHIFFNPL